MAVSMMIPNKWNSSCYCMRHSWLTIFWGDTLEPDRSIHTLTTWSNANYIIHSWTDNVVHVPSNVPTLIEFCWRYSPAFAFPTLYKHYTGETVSVMGTTVVVVTSRTYLVYIVYSECRNDYLSYTNPQQAVCVGGGGAPFCISFCYFLGANYYNWLV